mgnify:CR=1 FL=1
MGIENTKTSPYDRLVPKSIVFRSFLLIVVVGCGVHPDVSYFIGRAQTNASSEAITWRIKATIEERTLLIREIFKYINIVLSFSIVLVVIHSHLYLKKYMKNDQFDNKYITDEFKKVDYKRKSKSKYDNPVMM